MGPPYMYNAFRFIVLLSSLQSLRGTVVVWCRGGEGRGREEGMGEGESRVDGRGGDKERGGTFCFSILF